MTARVDYMNYGPTKKVSAKRPTKQTPPLLDNEMEMHRLNCDIPGLETVYYVETLAVRDAITGEVLMQSFNASSHPFVYNRIPFPSVSYGGDDTQSKMDCINLMLIKLRQMILEKTGL